MCKKINIFKLCIFFSYKNKVMLQDNSQVFYCHKMSQESGVGKVVVMIGNPIVGQDDKCAAVLAMELVISH